MLELVTELDRHLRFLMNRHAGSALIKRDVFPHLGFLDDLIEQHHMDKYRKDYESINYFYSLSLAPIFKENSSRALSNKLENYSMLTNVCGFSTIPHHGSFSDEYPKFKEPFLSAVVDHLVELLRVHGAIPKDDTVIYDVTFIISETEMSEWGWCGSTKGTEHGIRVHLAYGMKSDIPVKIIVTEGNVHELEKFDDLHLRAKQLGFKRNCKDRGYTDYDREKKIALDNEFYVTTMKSNCKYEVLRSKKVEHPHVISDKIIWITEMEMAVRALEAKKSRGIGTYHILTNDIFGKVDDIYGECKGRWNIETHNNFEKHVLGMNTIKSKSSYGVVASVYFCIIAFLLIKLFAVFHNAGNTNMRCIVNYLEYPADEMMTRFIEIRKLIFKAYDVDVGCSGLTATMIHKPQQIVQI